MDVDFTKLLAIFQREIEKDAIGPLRARVEALEREVAALRAAQPAQPEGRSGLMQGLLSRLAG